MKCFAAVRFNLKWLMITVCAAIAAAIIADSNSYAMAKPPDIFLVSIVNKLDQGDIRHDFERALIHALLERTKAEFGPYRILNAPPMSHNRSLQSLDEDIYPNFIRGFVYHPNLADQYQLSFIPVPILRGLMGYRTCFISQNIQQKFALTHERDQVLQFSHGYGMYWLDVLIMREAGVEVHELPGYMGLFNMVADNRFDLFCRSANEVLAEYQRFSTMKNFAYDQTKVFFYYFPFFLYANEKNTLLMRRLTRGFELMTSDGSFNRMWYDYHKQDLEFVELEKRQIIEIDNPLIKHLDPSFKKYIYYPQGEKNNLKNPD